MDIAKIFVAIFLGIVCSCAAYADLGCKVGIIDMNQILQNAPMMKTINDQLTKTFSSRQDDLNNAKKQLQADTKTLAENPAGMDSGEIEKLQDKLIYDKANIVITEAALEKDLTIAKKGHLKKFMARLAAVVKKIAQDGGYDLVEQKTNIVYLDDKRDLTQQVLKQLV